ncbi:Os02g0284300, partial [Oryza sativa Japonica Group]
TQGRRRRRRLRARGGTRSRRRRRSSGRGGCRRVVLEEARLSTKSFTQHSKTRALIKRNQSATYAAHNHIPKVQNAAPNQIRKFRRGQRQKKKRTKIPARRRPSIPWSQRFRISAEITTALLFLHQTKPEPLVHCDLDLKPANILLDRNILLQVLTSPPPTDSSATLVYSGDESAAHPHHPRLSAATHLSAPTGPTHRRPHRHARRPLPSPHCRAPCHAAPPRPPPWPCGTWSSPSRPSPALPPPRAAPPPAAAHPRRPRYRWPKGPPDTARPRHGPPAIGPAQPDRHFVPGRAGSWAVPPAQAWPTSRRAVPGRPKARVAHRAFFK